MNLGILLIFMFNKTYKFFLILAILFLMATPVAGLVWPTEKNLKVYFLDVGQGDSILIRAPSGQNILIDGGPNNLVLEHLNNILPFWDRTIDLMILTHAHSDHVAGLVDVLKRYDVAKVLYTGVDHGSPDFIEWGSLIEQKGTEVAIPIAGQVYQFGEVDLEILYPFEDISEKEFKDLNDSSVVARLEYQDTSFLFTGDAPVSVAKEVLEFCHEVKARALVYPCKLESDVLKVGHHGSKYSSSLEFLQAVNPMYAVIQSAEDNKFGHPHRLILKRLEGLGVEILRNDEVGDVKVVSDGRKVWVR